MRTHWILKFLLVSGLVAAVFTTQKFIFRIHSVTCTVPDTVVDCPTEITAQLQSLIASPLLFTALPEKVEKVLINEPFTVTAVHKKLPDSLQIELAPTNFVFGIQSTTRNFVVTASGEILEKAIPEAIPILTIADAALAASIVPDEHFTGMATTLFTTIAAEHIEYKNLTYISAQELRIDLQNPPITAIVNPSSVAAQLKTLNLILESKELQELPEQIKEIDLRFDFPVIRTAQLDT